MNRTALFSLLRCLTPAALLACTEPPPGADDTDTPAEESDTPADTDAAEEVLTAYDDVPTAMRCPVDDDGTNCLERATNAFRVDDEATLGWDAADYDPDTERLSVLLKPGATLDDRFVEGAFLYRGRKDKKPLMHRITGVRVEGDRVQIGLERANVKEVFPRGRVRTRIPVGATPANLRGRDGLPMAAGPADVSVGTSDCSGTLFDTTIATVNAHGTIDVSLTQCSFELYAWVDAVLVWDSLTNLDRVEVSAGGGLDASLHAELTAALDATYGASKVIWNGPEIPVTIGGLLITINPSLIGGYSLSAAAELSVAHGYDYSGSIEEGFGWSDRRGWYTIDERESEFTRSGPDVYFDGNITAKVFLKPRLDVKAFGILGGFIAVEGFAKAELSSTAERVGGQFEGEVCADLVVGLQPSIGAICEIPVVNITVFEEEVKLPAFSRTIGADLCASWSGPAPTDCDPSSGCCTDGECPPNTEDPSLTVSCDRGPQLVGGLYRYSCETHIPEGWCLTGSETAGDVTCDDGLEATVDECVENQCVNSYPLIDNLPVETHVACPAIAVDCCFVDSDCNDGVPGTDDVCEKDPGEGPNERGTCSHEVGLPPRF